MATSSKTSLLNILAGRASTRGAVTIHADVRLNNYAVDPTNIQVRKQIAFVAQDDSLQVTSTPRESIRFSAKLRLSRETTDDDLDRLTERMITELGLTSCADTIVGGALIKGISGGERKRTSVGVELVVVSCLYLLFCCFEQLYLMKDRFFACRNQRWSFWMNQPVVSIVIPRCNCVKSSKRWPMPEPVFFLPFINRLRKFSVRLII